MKVPLPALTVWRAINHHALLPDRWETERSVFENVRPGHPWLHDCSNVPFKMHSAWCWKELICRLRGGEVELWAGGTPWDKWTKSISHFGLMVGWMDNLNKIKTFLTNFHLDSRHCCPSATMNSYICPCLQIINILVPIFLSLFLVDVPW